MARQEAYCFETYSFAMPGNTVIDKRERHIARDTALHMGTLLLNGQSSRNGQVGFTYS
jgi:hypothetical protein